MQVNLDPVPKNTGSFNSADGLALALLQGLNASSVSLPTAREQRQEHEQQQAAQAAAASPSTADVMRQAERRLDPSSRSWKRRQVRAVAREQQMNRGRRAFRQALADAKGRGGRATEIPTPRGETARPTQHNSSADRAAKPAPVADADASKPPAANRLAQPGPSVATESRSSPTRAATTDQAFSTAGVWQPAPPVASDNAASDTAGTVKVAASGVVRSSAEVKPPGTAPVAIAGVRSSAKSGPVFGQRPVDSRPAQTADREANIERVLRTIHSRIGRQRSTAIVRLDPPALGSIRLHMDLRDSALTLRVDTQTDVAHRLLTEQLASLRRGLESAGLHLERVEIRPPNPTPDGAGESPAQASNQDGADGEVSDEAGAERSRQGGSGIDGHAGTEAGAESSLSSQTLVAAEETSPAAESLVNVLA